MKVEAQTQTKMVTKIVPETETIGVTIQLTTNEAQELERLLGCVAHLPTTLASLIRALHEAGIEKIEPRGCVMNFSLSREETK